MLLRNLVFLYHVIKASENLLTVAADLAGDGPLRDYFERHLEEERGHAAWLAEDLASVGLIAAQTKIPPVAMQMVGSVYYMVFHADPCALLGYMRVLESWPMPETRLHELEQRYPRSLLRTARYHAKNDPQHLADLTAVIEGLSVERRALVDQMSAVTREFLRKEAELIATRGES